MSELIVTIAGILAIMLIARWFWFSAPQATRAESRQPIDILVQDGAYLPAAIEVPAGQAVTLRFTRRDATPCAEKVLFGDLGVSADLPLGKPQTVSLGPLPAGTHEFTCQMGMYRGRLIASP
ncbi:MAG TPA: cupredoxin domain-containing protein [Novimethylophilus sp.]|jgi:plastocyanin domain-containing protein|uniref:cupredoxin domain-containing protein n=1 Tax=Novimethylophilus sp. TaxID=2137426 RepID=UPI002F3F20C6